MTKELVVTCNCDTTYEYFEVIRSGTINWVVKRHEYDYEYD